MMDAHIRTAAEVILARAADEGPTYTAQVLRWFGTEAAKGQWSRERCRYLLTSIASTFEMLAAELAK